nr:ribosome maturation factor RimP [candidate division Zixibacteria bacterium]
MSLKEKITGLITTPIENEGFELVELKLAQYKKQHRLRVFVDSDHGVTIDDCVRLTKAIDPILEENNVFRYGYVIEVSSPGLDRPLQTARDFRRRIGERIRIQFIDPATPSLEGELVGADDRFLEIQTGDDLSKVDLVQVKWGKIIF